MRDISKGEREGEAGGRAGNNCGPPAAETPRLHPAGAGDAPGGAEAIFFIIYF